MGEERREEMGGGEERKKSKEGRRKGQKREGKKKEENNYFQTYSLYLSAIYCIQNIKCIDVNFQEKNNFLILLPVSK